MIVCLGSDGRVAETGTFKELSNKEDGAFRRLMEWQMSGGEQPKRVPSGGPRLTEEEELLYSVDSEGELHEEVDEAAIKEKAKKAEAEKKSDGSA